MLKGIELIDCAKANAKQGVEVAAAQSGYDDINLFARNLRAACQEIGVNINELEDLITDQQIAKENRHVEEVAPESVSDL